MKLNIVDNLDIAPDEGINYMVELSVGSFRIASGASSGTLSLSAYGWRKEGDNARTAYACHYALYTRTGTTFSRKAYSGSKSTSWASGSLTIESTVEEVVVVISDSVMSASSFASVLPLSILAKTSVAVSKDGNTGVGISSVTEYYLASASSSGVNRQTSGWTTDPTASAATISSSKKYLWNYEKITYSDNSTAYTDPVIIGRYGDTGVGISSVTEYYLASASSSGVTRSTSGWTTDPTASAATISSSKKYLWNYEKITYSDNTKAYTDPVIIGTYGEKGNAGVGISSVTEYYLASASSSGVTRSTSGWTTDPTASAATISSSKKYLWNYEKITYSDNTTAYTDPVIIGRYGDTGVGISSVTEYYLASASSSGVTRQTSGWTTDPTASAATISSSKKYLWNYEKITYSDNTKAYTDPVIIGTYGEKGNAGDNAATAYASPDKISIPCYSGGGVKEESTTSVIFYLSVGDNAVIVTSVSSGTKPTGVTVTGRGDNAVTITVGTTATASGLAAGVTFTVNGTYNGKSYSAKITVALIGAVQGAQGQSITGATGKMCYICGEYSSSITYVSDSKQTVAVEITGSGNTVELFVLKASTNVVNGTHYAPLDSNGNLNSTYWERGLNAYNLVRTKYLFANFASLGSFIVSGDWMYSQKGAPIKVSTSTTVSSYSSGSRTVLRTFTPKSTGNHNFSFNGTVSTGTLYVDIYDNSAGSSVWSGSLTSGTTSVSTGNLSLRADHAYSVRAYKSTSSATDTVSVTMTTPTDYLYFVASDPQGSSTMHFAPNYAMDGMTGRTYQNSAYLQGEIQATSGRIGGIQINGTGGLRSYKTISGSTRLALEITPNGDIIVNGASITVGWQGIVSTPNLLANLLQLGMSTAYGEGNSVILTDSATFTLPSTNKIGTVIFIKGRNYSGLKVYPPSGLSILRGDGTNVTTYSDIGKRSAIYIRADDGQNYSFDGWIEWLG
jgi:hypothetical protein